MYYIYIVYICIYYTQYPEIIHIYPTGFIGVSWFFAIFHGIISSGHESHLGDELRKLLEEARKKTCGPWEFLRLLGPPGARGAPNMDLGMDWFKGKFAGKPHI